MARSEIVGRVVGDKDASEKPRTRGDTSPRQSHTPRRWRFAEVLVGVIAFKRKEDVGISVLRELMRTDSLCLITAIYGPLGGY